MIVRNVIICGLGTVGGMIKRDEPSKIYFIEYRIGRFQIGERLIIKSDENKVNLYMEFDDVRKPLEMVKELEKAKTLRRSIVYLKNVIFDFSRDRTEKSWLIVKSYFYKVSKGMAKKMNMNRNDYSKLVFQIVGA